ncbi:MAG: TldD/PmbA family protein [Candidatus Nezhaarchaeales archaeon]
MRSSMETVELEDLCEYAVKVGVKLGASYVEVRGQLDEGRTLTSRNGVIEAYTSSLSSGIGLRVLVNGSVGLASLNELSKEAVKDRVKEAVKMAKASIKLAEKVKLSEEETVRAKWAITERKDFDDVPLEEKVKLLTDLDRRLTSLSVNVAARILELSELRAVKYYANSEGSSINGYAPRIMAWATLVVKEVGDSEQAFIQRGGSGGWEVFEGLKFEDECVKTAIVLGRLLREAKLVPSGEIDIVLGGDVTGIAVHESTGHPYEADRILGREVAQAGGSFVKPDMLGRTIGSECVTVIDDPTLNGGYGSYAYDDEGVKARPKLLMKNGRINEFLHNRFTAAVFNVKSNGSARVSDYAKEPLVRMSNTYIAPGDYGLEELIEGVKLGVYVLSFTEWNIDDVRYNMRIVGGESYLIENGKITGMVRRPIVEITTPAFYSSIDAVGKELVFQAASCGKGDPQQPVPVWTGGPAIRLRKVRVAKP